MIASNLIKPQILRISLKGSKCIYGIFRQKYCLLQFYLVLFYIIVIGPDILFHAATLIMLQMM